MKKFFILVKKEVRELLTPQLLVPMILIVVLFVGLGKVMGSQAKKITAPQAMAIIDLDNSSLSQGLNKALSTSFKIEAINSTSDIQQEMKDKKISFGIVIPQKFETSINSGQSPTIASYTVLSNFSFAGSRNASLQKAALAIINDTTSNYLLTQKLQVQNPKFVKTPITPRTFVTIGDKTALIDPEQVLGFVSQQTVFIPIILFIVIVFASQMVATAMAQEKENKTLETLLSAPVSRNSIIAAKLVGASIASLLMAAVYMYGFSAYLKGMTGALPATAGVSTAALSSLGLVLGPIDYTVLGISLFFGILAALSVAIILAAFVEDVKSVQAVTAPLMVLVMIPYFLVLFLDFAALPAIARYAVYLIPFSHPFLASQNVFLHNYMPIIYGIGYEILFFAVFVYIAAKIFSSDKLLTLKLNFKKRK